MGSEKSNPRQPNVTRRDMLVGAAALTAGLKAAAAARDALAAQDSQPQDQVPFQLKDLRQIAFIVKDIQTASKRYADLLGMSVPNAIITDPVEKAKTLYRGTPTPARAKLAFLNVGPITFELIEPIGEPSTWNDFLDKHGEGVHHLGFHIEDMDEALAVLNNKSFETIQTGDFTTGCYAYVDTSLALGIIVELLKIY
jgi:methylmalonyl-CoA/ethylmalonyl-CoA epimerase